MKKNLIILLSAVVILVVAAISLRSLKKPQTNTSIVPTPTLTSQNLKTFKSSSAMDFTIEVPKDDQVTEQFGSVTVTTNVGKIYIDRNGTNFSNIQDYLNDLHFKNKTVLDRQSSMIINDFQAISGFIGKDKNYYIYICRWYCLFIFYKFRISI